MYLLEKEEIMKKNVYHIIVLSILLCTALPLSAAAGLFGPAMPGSVEGSGTHFEVTDSDYLNVTLSSSATLDLYMVSNGGVIEILTDSEDTPAVANLIISGL